MQFETLKQEQEFDHYASEWLTNYRHPGTADLAKVIQRAYEIGGLPCVSLFERSYRELLAAGEVKLATEKLAEPVVAKPEVLTAEAYHRLAASQVMQRRKSDPLFRQQMDELIRRGEI